MTFLTQDKIETLHLKHAPTPAIFRSVWAHSLAVRDLAITIGMQIDDRLDLALVEVGALVHDVGVYRLVDGEGQHIGTPYLMHGLLGEDLLRDEGYPDEVCRFASHHIGAGITARQVLDNALPLPPRDFLAETVEESLVMYADKFHTKSDPPAFVAHASASELLRRHGSESSAAFTRLTEQFGIPDLRPLADKHGHSIITSTAP